jgi:hypothetical protein
MNVLRVVLMGVISTIGVLNAGLNCVVDREMVAANSASGITLTISDFQQGDISAKIYDSSGKFVRALAEKCTADSRLQIAWDLKDNTGRQVEKGTYSIKVRSRMTLTLDRKFGKDGVLTADSASGDAFISPTVIRTDAKGKLYLLDYGAGIIYKYNPDGSPSNDIAGKNRIPGAASPYWTCMAVDQDGNIYATIGHGISVYDAKSGEAIYTIGGFFGNDINWEKTKGGLGWPGWVCVGGGDRLYASCPGYSYWAAFDRRKKGFEAGLWRSKGGTPGDSGDTNMGKIIYLANAYYTGKTGITRWIDKDTEVEMSYAIAGYVEPVTKIQQKLNDVNGVAYDGEGGIFLALRSPVKIVKIFDNGTGFDFVAAFGSRGEDAAKLQFMAPHSVVVSPDRKSLYVVEDGEIISKDEPNNAGLARIVKYLINYTEEKEMKVTVQ